MQSILPSRQGCTQMLSRSTEACLRPKEGAGVPPCGLLLSQRRLLARKVSSSFSICMRVFPRENQ
jgi:hypothetical protein